MATTGADRERVEMNLPTGAKDRLDVLRKELLQEAQAAAQDTGPFADRGLFIAWLGDTLARILARRQEIEETAREAEERIRVAEDAEVQMEQRLAQLTQRENDLRATELRVHRSEGLSGWMLGLFAELEERGLDRSHIVQVAQVMRDSGLDPEDVAPAMRRENIGGLLGYGAQLRAAIEEAQAALAELREQVATNAQAVRILEAQAQGMRGEIEQTTQDLQFARHQLQMAGLRAQELGIYVDWLRSLGVERVEDLPAETARLIAGTVLLGSVGAHGDRMLSLPPAPGLRIVGGQVKLSEIPYLLAPPEQYELMRQTQGRRGAMARDLAAQGAPAGGPEA